MVRNCYLVGLNDLDGSQSYVQDVQAKYMNDLINIGVAGIIIFTPSPKSMFLKDFWEGSWKLGIKVYYK